MTTFPIDEKSLAHLRSKDPVLGKAIEEIGILERETTPDLFTGLILSLVAQQISGKAAETVSRRLLDLCEQNITPTSITALSAEHTPQSHRFICGISQG